MTAERLVREWKKLDHSKHISPGSFLINSNPPTPPPPPGTDPAQGKEDKLVCARTNRRLEVSLELVKPIIADGVRDNTPNLH